jgi:hypothetical protein
LFPQFINRTLNGYSNIFIYASEVQSGCKIIADGTSAANAAITVDFGQGLCTSGTAVTLDEGSIFIGDAEVVSFGTPYKDIVFIMTECNDMITIAKTYADTSSVEVLGYGGDDIIVIGNAIQALDTGIFGSLIIDGGEGFGDRLLIQDQGSSAAKEITIRPTMLNGIHGSRNQTVSYFSIEQIDMSLGNAAAQVYMFATAKDDWLPYSLTHNSWLENTLECLKPICLMGQLKADLSLTLTTQGENSLLLLSYH